MTVALVIVGALTLVSAVNVIISKSTIYSALSLVLAVGMLSVMYLLLNAQFLFVVQLIIYAGAVMVLFVFIIALLSPTDEDRPRFDMRMVAGLLGVLTITALTVLLALNNVTSNPNATCDATTAPACAFHGYQVGAANNPFNSFSFNYGDTNGHGNVQTVGGQLFTTFVLPFEVTSLILLVSVIGAVYLTRARKAAR